ncbi:EthD domain-containing protein [Aspergillus crustosus]
MTSKQTILPRPTNPLIRVSCFFTRSPTISPEEFNTYWRETHGTLVIASKIFHEAQIQGYTQVHRDHTLTAEAAKMGSALLEFNWDACSEMYFHTWEDYRRFAESDEMRDVLGPDGGKILDGERGVRVLVTRVDPISSLL